MAGSVGETAKLIASLTLDTKGFASGATKAIGGIDKVEGRFKKLGASASHSMKNIGIGLAAVGTAAAVGIAAAVHAGISALAEDEVAAAQTAAVLESTGKAAHVSAAQIDELTQSLQTKVAVDDAVIRGGVNMLLTFTNIRNEVGAGNDIFNQSIATLADMSRAMGGDMSKAAIQLGKALNDPIKGLTALSKVGVTFTGAQKAEIQGFVSAGDAIKDFKNANIDLTKKQKELIKGYGPAITTLAAADRAHVKLTKAQRLVFKGMEDGTGQIKAQKIILAELNKEFGGSGAKYAETYAGTIEGLGFAVEDAQKALAKGFMPVISKVSKFLQTQLARKEVLEGIEHFGDMMAGFFDEAANFAMSIPWSVVLDTFSGIATVAKTAVDAFRAIPTWAQELLIGGFVVNKFTGGALGGIVKELAGGLIKGVLGIQAANVDLKAANVNMLGGGGVGGGGIGGAPAAAAGGGALAAIGSAALVTAAGGAAVIALYQIIPRLVSKTPGFDPNIATNKNPANVGTAAWRQIADNLGMGAGAPKPAAGGRGDKSTAAEVKRLGERQALAARIVAAGGKATAARMEAIMAKNAAATAANASKIGFLVTGVNRIPAAVAGIRIPAPVVNVTVPVSVRAVTQSQTIHRTYNPKSNVGSGPAQQG